MGNNSIKNITCRIVNLDTGEILKEKVFEENAVKSLPKPTFDAMSKMFFDLCLHVPRIGFECYADSSYQPIQLNLF